MKFTKTEMAKLSGRTIQAVNNWGKPPKFMETIAKLWDYAPASVKAELLQDTPRGMKAWVKRTRELAFDLAFEILANNPEKSYTSYALAKAIHATGKFPRSVPSIYYTYLPAVLETPGDDLARCYSPADKRWKYREPR